MGLKSLPPGVVEYRCLFCGNALVACHCYEGSDEDTQHNYFDERSSTRDWKHCPNCGQPCKAGEVCDDCKARSKTVVINLKIDTLKRLS